MQNRKSNNKKNSHNKSFFKRKVDKNQIPTCNIMGVEIAAIDMDWLLCYFKKNVKNAFGNQLSGDYICVSNVHTTVTAYENNEYCLVQNSGLMAIPDGGPLSTIGKKRGYKNMRRTTGPDLMSGLFEVSIENGYRHYFYGSTKKTLDKLHTELKLTYPGINIAGMYSPPFRPLSADEDKLIIKNINDSNPDFIWVGLGAPKQEIWMADHQWKVKGLMIGVGAGFDYFAGNIERAPIWMQRCNMEWFYRLIQEPKRLFVRYMKTNFKFIWCAMIRGK